MLPTVDPITMDFADTIVAIASATTPSPRGVVRLSGDEVHSLLVQILPAAAGNLSGTGARRISVTIDVGDPLGPVDADLLFWPDRRSFTGQPSAEFHTHGSLPVLQSLVQTAIRAGARAARPGEFTMRAFLAGRLDLTQAEAVLGVIEAEERGSLNHALRQLAGNLSRPLERIRSELLDLVADVEAGLDFVDEDIEFISDSQLTERLSKISSDITETQTTMSGRMGWVERTEVVLCGQPNAGKSSLVNAIAGHQAAIVTELAGTTRDTVTIDTEIDRHPVRLVDTAGIEAAQSEIDRLAQSQAGRAADAAQIVLRCVDSHRPDFANACRQLAPGRHPTGRSTIEIRVATKCDRDNVAAIPPDWIATSAHTGAGLDRLKQAITEQIDHGGRHDSGTVVGTAARCGHSLQAASGSVDSAIRMISQSEGHELIAAELRSAAASLGEVTGAVYTDDILDRVFSRFCIGK